MSTFSGDIGPEEEDGGGWGGLIPTKAEREESRLRGILIERVRSICVKGGVPATVMSEICRVIRYGE